MISMLFKLTLASSNIFYLPTLIVAQTNNGNGCSCFLTNGSSSAYYTYHRFHDFRNIDSSLISNPEVLIDGTNTTNAAATSEFFFDQAWTKDWEIQSWNNSDVMSSNNATVLMINSANNIYIENSSDSSKSHSTYLTLRTTRTPDFQSAAEFDSNEQNYHYLSVRFLARVIGSPGACAGLFTYLASSPIQEADIEILTSGPRNVIQYTNQPSNSQSGDILADATANTTIPGGLDWSSWNTHRLDWMPTQSSWYVNGISVANISFQVPRDPAGLIVNMWSDGGPWTANMSLHDAAFLQIQYIEIVYNTSGPYSGSASTTSARIREAEATPVSRLGREFKIAVEGGLAGRMVGPRREADGIISRRDSSSAGCKVVCSIDEEVNASSIGTPVVLYNNTGAASSYTGSGHWSAWMPGMIITSLMGIGLCL